MHEPRPWSTYSNRRCVLLLIYLTNHPSRMSAPFSCFTMRWLWICFNVTALSPDHVTTWGAYSVSLSKNYVLLCSTSLATFISGPSTTTKVSRNYWIIASSNKWKMEGKSQDGSSTSSSFFRRHKNPITLLVFNLFPRPDGHRAAIYYFKWDTFH